MRLKFIIILIALTNIVFAQNYHDTQGKLDISSGGQATFTVPIALPPSINSVGPTINLTYTSGNPTGIAGQGWNISSISSISRVATRMDVEGFRDGVDFDQDDRLALDGQYLLSKSGNYWASGSTYQTEVQSNIKIELQGSGSSMYFIVTAPDGSRSWYGNYNGQVASDLSAFYISRYEDTDGNFITYHYLSSFNSLTIEEIRFSANINSNPTPLNKILFKYEDAARTESFYIKEIEVKRSKILDYIEVFTDNLRFKKYELNHIVDENGYQRVTNIQEFNNLNEPANPIVFEYNRTEHTSVDRWMGYQGSFSSSFNHTISGDFDGDGRLDFANANQIFLNIFSTTSNGFQANDNVINLPITLTKDKIFAVTTLQNNKLLQKQSILKVEDNNTTIDFKTYSLSGTSLPLINTKTITINNLVNSCQDYCVVDFEDANGNVVVNPNSRCNQGGTFKKSSTKYLEGDFNGDSISEMLIISFNERKTWNLTNGLCKPGMEILGVEEVRLLDLNPNNPSLPNTIGNYSIQSTELDFLDMAKYFIADFNADGKSDLMAIKPKGLYKVFSFKENTVAQTISLEIIGQGTIINYAINKAILFGDYNGDGKTDIMIPDTHDVGCQTCDTWHIYFSNPKLDQTEMFVKITKEIVPYWTDSKDTYDTQYYYNQYYAIDINKDGKTDLLKLWIGKYQPQPFWDDSDWDTKWKVDTYINNLGFTGEFDNQYTSFEHTSQDPNLPVPIVLNLDFYGGGRIDKFNSDITVLRWDRLEYLDLTKDYAKDNLLKKVSQSNNSIINEIEFGKLSLPIFNNGFGVQNELYMSNDDYNYPIVEFKQMPTFDVVKKLTNTSGESTKKQDFKYNGLTFDIKGVGLIGFKRAVRSNWYFTDTDKKIWVETISDPLKRGAIVSTLTHLPSNGVFPFFSSAPSNTQLVNKNEFNFQQINAVGTYPYVLLKQSEKNTDCLSGVVKETDYFYTNDGYYHENKSTTKSYTLSNPTLIQGISQVETTYSNVTGSGGGYFIGRPDEVIKTNKLFVNTIVNNSADNSNTKVSSEKMFYNNNNLLKTEKTANGSTEKLVEDFTYFPNGLLQSKTVSAQGTTSSNAVVPVVTEYTYDATNRFVKTTKNVNDDLTITNVSFDAIYGLVKSSTNAIGQTTTSLFDGWGKQTKVTDFLGKSITYTYTKNGNLYTTTQTGDDGSTSMVEQDELTREIRKGSKDMFGNWSYVKTEYDSFGRKYRVSEPYLSTSSPTQWSYLEYDLLSRPVKTTSHTGKEITTAYNVSTMGPAVISFEPLMSKYKFLDANGLTYKSEDSPGGTIFYKYDANGNLLESDYDGIKTKIKYDNWGRKSELEDTSAGIYTYSYDAFGRVKTETTPKGSTTITYDNGGRVLTKTLTGLTPADATSMVATYVYDNTTKWLTNLSITNTIDGNSSYDYSYDPATKQLNQTVEKLFNPGSTTPVATFTKLLTFDLFGRVVNETSTALSYGKTSSKTITHVYQNGAEYQLKDGTNIIWQANSINSRGQLTSSQLNNGVNALTITNTYDDYGYLIQQKHNKGTTNLMTLSNQFNPVLGNLMTRYSSLFDSREFFQYDNLDRLIKWDGISTTILNLPFNTTTDGFTFIGGSTKGSVTNSAGTLKVVLKEPSIDSDFPIAAQRSLPTGIVSGDQIRLRATITNKTGSNGVIVSAVIVETDPADPHSYVAYEIGTVENGAFDATYQISNFVANPILRLRFIVSPNSPQNSNGGGPIISNATFYVDNLKIDKVPLINQNYDNRGRITQNNFGDYKYEIANKPYQNSKVKLSPQGQSYYATNASAALDINYNMFSSPYKIALPGKDIVDLSYNIMEQRSMMFWGSTAVSKNQRPFRRYYSADGSMEVTANFTGGNYTTPSSVAILTYIDGNAYSSEIVLKNTFTGTATTPTGGLFYLHRDYQGSIVAVSNATGAIIEKRQYDPWGLITKIQDGAGTNLTKLTFFDRGYTGHEHLESVGLINMNGRIYDPILHRFLQPDSKVQEPYNTQNYNRYGYCLNNPLKYTDISGEDFGLTFAISMGVALAVYFGDALLSHKPITFRGIATTVVTTAVSAGISYGIGSIASNINNFYARATFQALAHGATQGGMAALQGGKFWSGFAAGALSSIMSSAWQGGKNIEMKNGFETTSYVKGIGGTDAFSTVGTMFVGSISGGAGAALTGGNFWQGSTTGLIVSGLNHFLHEGVWRRTLLERFNKIDPYAVPEQNIESVNKLLKDVSDLGAWYTKSGKPKIGFKGYKVGTNADTYQIANNDVIVDLYSGAFESYYKLASTLFHEFYHSYQIISGHFQIAQNKYKIGVYTDIRYGLEIETKSKAWIEMKAYKFQILMGDRDMRIISEHNDRASRLNYKKM
ncbi:RHS repeat-associated core domain-containing protein [Flavobacterium sp.]|uniref:RHS repeat-associated core domain-containing protein n=1 Tax=Flavobacterium sp. TaxID=239 RepID=UPI002604A543|nr:RHS repeat-associated core domain-containing protein [Flavobacterium sp.]